MSSFLPILRLGLVNPEGYIAFSLFPHLSAIPLSANICLTLRVGSLSDVRDKHQFSISSRLKRQCLPIRMLESGCVSANDGSSNGSRADSLRSPGASSPLLTVAAHCLQDQLCRRPRTAGHRARRSSTPALNLKVPTMSPAHVSFYRTPKRSMGNPPFTNESSSFASWACPGGSTWKPGGRPASSVPPAVKSDAFLVRRGRATMGPWAARCNPAAAVDRRSRAQNVVENFVDQFRSTLRCLNSESSFIIRTIL